MHRLTFFPLGNADCCLIDLANAKKVVVDFANLKDERDPKDRRIDLARALRENLKSAKRNFFDVVAFTHLDRDHLGGSCEFFHLEHAEKYQGSDRIRIGTMWVPAAAVTEEGVDDEARIIRAEARFRLKKGRGIRIFSRPERLREWLASQGVRLEDRLNLITDAGGVAPDFNLQVDGVEFFIHSPFAHRLNKTDLEDRNGDALAFQATFVVDGVPTKVLFGTDLDHDALSEIVEITRARNRDERLEWDVIKVPHHCSYLSLGPEKGRDTTQAVPNVAWLYEKKGARLGKVLSSSLPIPASGNEIQPPHRQAANYYRSVVDSQHLNGEFLVTMEHRKADDPEPIVVIIDKTKARIKGPAIVGGAAILSRPAPRAG